MQAILRENAPIEIHEVKLDWSDGTPKVVEDRIVNKDEENGTEKDSI